MNTSPIIVGLTGLPSAGKSTMINAIAGKRVLRSGVCRTTLDVHLIGEENKFNFPPERFHQHNIRDDDDNPLIFLDLPGVADSENKGSEVNYDEMTQAWITNCDVILWLTDITTAFLTTHELEEFTKIYDALRKNSLETGTYYHIAVVLTKCNFHESGCGTSSSSPSLKSTLPSLGDEIESDEEETTLEDCVIRVENIFEKYDEKVDIIKFNAFGRIFHHSGSSYRLINMVKKTMKGAFYVNTAFSLQFAIDQHETKQQLQLFLSLRDHHFKQTPLSKERITDVYAKINDPDVLAKLMRYLITPDVIPLKTALEVAKLIGYSNKMEMVYDSLEQEIKYSKHAFNCLVNIVGDNNMNLYRNMLEFYTTLHFAKWNPQQRHQHHNHGHPYFPEFKSHVCGQFPIFTDLDTDLIINPVLACQTEFLAKVRDQRLNLWGVASEKKKLTFMIIHLFMQGFIPSLFVKII